MGVFEPDILNEPARGARATAPPEWQLMVAILADAIECFQKNLGAPNPKRRRLFNEAEAWIRSDDVHWVFSFRSICDVLGLDAVALRQQTEAWKRQRLGGGVGPQRIALGGGFPHQTRTRPAPWTVTRAPGRT